MFWVVCQQTGNNARQRPTASFAWFDKSHDNGVSPLGLCRALLRSFRHKVDYFAERSGLHGFTVGDKRYRFPIDSSFAGYLPNSYLNDTFSSSAFILQSTYSAHRKSTRLKSSPCSQRREVPFRCNDV